MLSAEWCMLVLSAEWCMLSAGAEWCMLSAGAQACRVLELPKFGLGWLLKEFCAVEADKKYQRAGLLERSQPTDGGARVLSAHR